jgi:hypothetical protein
LFGLLLLLLFLWRAIAGGTAAAGLRTLVILAIGIRHADLLLIRFAASAWPPAMNAANRD